MQAWLRRRRLEAARFALRRWPDRALAQGEKPGRAGGAAGTRTALGWMTGARYQIAVDGQPRSNRDDKAIAIEAAEYLKYKHPHAEVTMHDLVTGDTISIKALPPGRAP